MEEASKETVRVLRELAGKWASGSVPNKLLLAIADVLNDYFDQDPDWYLQLPQQAPGNRLCTCGHRLRDHNGYDGSCTAGAGTSAPCGCMQFTAQDYVVGSDPAAPGTEESGTVEIARQAIQKFRALRSVNDPLGTEDKAEAAVVQMFEDADRLAGRTP
jgi:hypothetical protein